MQKFFNISTAFSAEIVNKFRNELSNRQAGLYYESNNPKSLRPSYPNSVIPEETLLSRMIEVAFGASIKKEEGRSLKFSIGYYDPNTVETSNLFPFATPLDFTVETVFKLAPSLADTLGLAVKAVDDELKIVGLFTLFVYDPCMPVKVKVLDAGEILVAFENENFAKISLQESTLIKNPYSHFNSNIWRGFPFVSKPWVDPYILLIIRTLTKMRLLGHGGCLVVLPKDAKPPIPNTDITYPMSYNPEFITSIVKNLANTMREGLNSGEITAWNNIPIKHIIDIEAVAKIVAQLTSVDGATILTKNFEVLGYGVKLTTPATETFEFDEFNSMTGESKIVNISNLKGTRHQSAIRFVNNNLDALAFVVSQDGNITAIIYDGNKVKTYRHFEVSLF